MKKIGICIVIVVGITALLLAYDFFSKDFNFVQGENALKNTENINEEENLAQIDENIDVKASVPIFMYHWLKEDTGGYEYPENIAKPSELRKQMEYLKENNYDAIFVSELDSLQHYEKPVALTFDDGWSDVYFEAFPLAKELNMKFSMYVIIDLIGTDFYCNVDQLKEMRDSGLVEINSHTMSHPYLDTLNEEETIHELVDSKKWLKDNLDIDSKVICYPSGRNSDITISIAKDNYKYGLLMDGGVFNYDSNTSNMYKIPRIYAKRSMTLDEFINYCSSASVNVN